MAITYPLNIIDDLDGVGWSTEFNLLYRQEQSRHASGRTRVKDLGTPLWQATYVTKNLSPNKLDYWKAKLNSLENGINTFIAYPRSRCWPIAHPNGLLVNSSNWVLETGFWNDGGLWLTSIPWDSNELDSGVINEINDNNKALSLKDVPSLKLSIGDFISINNLLYQVMEDAETNLEGITTEFEVRPHLNITVNPNDTVLLHKPHCYMTLVPNSINSSSGLNGRGSISFQSIESRG
jgi:hypothetical protein